MSKRITLLISQSQSKNPSKRKLEEALVAGLLDERGVDVTVVPHFYDLTPDSPGMLCLQGISGDMIVCSWLFPRAAHWILDRNQIRGTEGATLLKGLGEDDDVEEPEQDEDDDKTRVVDQRERPNRTIYCLDLRTSGSAEPFLEEIRRIASEATTETVSLSGEPSSNGLPARSVDAPSSNGSPPPPAKASEAEPARRWYPVIDYSRCTNCLECIDFCLFGVYGIDKAETILVDQPDNCRKGCPACSRVCPENAIIFPQHKSPAIAGNSEFAGALKIDLSQLFGAPETQEGIDIAVQERDEQLQLAGRDVVGASVGLPKRGTRATETTDGEPDELDALIDELDGLDL